jgi:DNA-binding MarR family transcriptional regulator
MNDFASSRRSLDRFVVRIADLMPRFMQAALVEERTLLSSGLVTVPQLWALAHLDRGGPCPMSALAQALRLTPPTATCLVDRLAAMRLVRRQAEPRDRRVVRLALSPRGRRLMAGFRVQKRKSARRHFSALSEPERETFLLVLEKLVRQAEDGEEAARQKKRRKSG